MNVFLLLHRGAAAIGSVEKLSSELLNHSLFATRAAISHQPTNRQRRAPLRQHFDRHLVVRTTNAAALHFKHRLHVLNSLLEELQRLIPTLGLKVGHGLIEDALGSRLLTTPHHAVDELRNQRRSIDRISWHIALGNKSFSRHLFFFLFFPQRGEPLTSWACYGLNLSAESESLLAARLRPLRAILRAAL